MNIFDAASSVSIREIYKAYAPASHVSRMRSRGNVPCPFHGEDAKPSMSFHPTDNYCRCFVCNKSYKPIDFVMSITGISSRYESAKEICQHFNVEYDIKPGGDMTPEEYAAYKNYTSVYSWVAKLFNFFYKQGVHNVDNVYERRGLSNEVIDKYQLGYCPRAFIDKNNNVLTLKHLLINQFPSINSAVLDSYGLYDKVGNCVFADRLTIPIFDKRGNVVAFSGRAISNTVVKYYNTTDTAFFSKKDILYNYHVAKKYSTVIVVEGFFDALSLISCGVFNIVASMGTAFTSEHLELLKGKEVYLSFDNDTAGLNSTLSVIEKNPQQIFKVILQTSDAKDFNEALQLGIDIKSLVSTKHAIYDVEFVLQYLASQHNLACVFEAEDVYNRVCAVLSKHSPVAYARFYKRLMRMLVGKEYQKKGGE